MYSRILFFCLLISGSGYAQNSLVTEQLLKEISRVAAHLPSNITEAHANRVSIKLQYDSLEQMIKTVFPSLADKMKRRSARLNSLAGYNDEGATLSIIPFSQQFANYFRNQQEKMDALEKAIAREVQPFYGKELYKTQGYIPAWDSVYRQRLPALIRYRDGIFRLVKEEIAYLKANEKMFRSSNESERMQYVEQEASVVQKLIHLKDRLHRIVVADGIEKVGN